MRADFAAGDPPRFTSPREVFDVPGIVDFDVAHRSDRFLAIVPEENDQRVTVSGLSNWTSLVAP